MGCTSSKLDDLPAVTLCRDRCTYLDEAIHYRYALSEAHIAYLHSLKTIGLSLHNFFESRVHAGSGERPHSNECDVRSLSEIHDSSKPELIKQSSTTNTPVVTINQNSSSNNNNQDSNSSSGSHLQFHSDSDSDSDDGSCSGSEPLHHHSGTLHNNGQFKYPDHETLGSGAFYPVRGHETLGPGTFYPVSGNGGDNGVFMHMNFMRNQTMPSVTYEQRPVSTETVRMNESAYPSSYYNYQDYPNYGGGFFASSTAVAGPSLAPSSSKAPPPPPSPPRSSPWEFLNPFETFESYLTYTSSRDSREVREEEGIPDLESEDFEHEVVKEVHVDQKFVDGGGSGGSYSEAVVENVNVNVNENERGADSELLHRPRPSSSTENDPVEYEVHVVDKKVVDEEESRGNVKAFKSDSDVVKEIQVQFERASESGNELAKMLEVGKLPHNRKHATYQVSSKMLHAINPSVSMVSLPSTSKNAAIEITDPAVLDVEGDISSRPRNISSTLQKLYLWEKKLYEEVKAEEKIRVLHERRNRKLKQLDEKGAESHKVDMTRKLVRSLSTKIRIAIQVVDKVSEKINKLRDEELWPQLNELIQGLSRMWKCMLECHRYQCLAIGEAKRLDAIASHDHFSDAHLEATLQLEHELLNWTLRFSCWVSAQKGYVRALNNWLMKCLLYVPEETDDGIAPFSPGRIGAPPIFVICNNWSQAFERVSEKEVVDCLRDFATNVLQLWERDKLELRQRMNVSKDMERQVKNLEREDQKIQKGIHALDKRIVLVSGEENALSLNKHIVYQSETSKNSSFQVGLLRIFEAMERFTANSLKVYEELLQRIEEDRLARDHEALS